MSGGKFHHGEQVVSKADAVTTILKRPIFNFTRFLKQIAKIVSFLDTAFLYNNFYLSEMLLSFLINDEIFSDLFAAQDRQTDRAVPHLPVCPLLIPL